MLQAKALEIIYKAMTPNGILASSTAKDNYAKIWSRDSMMTGILGIAINDEKIINAHYLSLMTLTKNQAENGQIPSNVDVSIEGDDQVSFGSLVGRVDATTWWIIGTCLYLKYKKNKELNDYFLPKVEKALHCLKTWEFNNRGLLYTPLGGNWADEYLTTGYTLYDNVLRFWALQTAGEVFIKEHWVEDSKKIKTLLEENFKQNTSKQKKYHPTAYQKTPALPFYYACFSANGYETLFDLAGNALALFLDFEIDVYAFENYLFSLEKEFQHWMLPVFYPIIKPEDYNWHFLENNYSFDFKNKPYHFHNGGSWPIFLGWLCWAMNRKNATSIPKNILTCYEQLLIEKNDQFSEYFSTDHLEACGAKKLCFSAVGYLMMKIK